MCTQNTHTQNTHIIPVHGCGCGEGVVGVGVAEYSQTFIRRQAIREEWTILALHFCQSVDIYIHTHTNTRAQTSTTACTHTYAYKQTQKREKQDTVDEPEQMWETAKAARFIPSHTGEICFLKHKIKQTHSTLLLLRSVDRTCGL